jgi:hypothetical protein
MASIISAGTTSGTSLNLSADTSGVLQLATNGTTTAVTIDTSQNVGIGTSSPESIAGYSILQVGNSTSTKGVVQSSDGTVKVAMYLGADALARVGTRTNDPVLLITNGTERLRLNTSGTVILQGGSTSATGVGITFPATQSASSDANTLDDYEEGTWTPVLTDLTNNATMTSTVGRYIKIGRTVSLQAQVQTSSLGSVTGNIYISGLPFQAEGTAGNYAGSVAGSASNLAITANQSVSILTDPGASFLQLFMWDDAAGTTRMQASEWSSDGSIRFSITYFSQS